jgi:hypothetical protein
MGDPTYDAMRAAAKAEAARDKLAAEVLMAALEALGAFFKGKATLSVTPTIPQGLGGAVGWNIRFVRDAEAPK